MSKKPISSDLSWPLQFEKVAHTLRLCLGDTVLEIHHVGSTAVPGLMAKPMLDVILVVRDPSLVVEPLRAQGFIYKGEYNIPFRSFYKGPGVHLHVYPPGHPEIELNLRIRDHLKAHGQSRQCYAALKKELMQMPHAFEPEGSSLLPIYTLKKDPFIRNLLHETGFDRVRFLFCLHHEEWTQYHRIKKEQIFDPIPLLYDPSHPSLSSPSHFHFVLAKGVRILGIAHGERLEEETAAIRSLAIDGPEGYGKILIQQLECWFKAQGVKILKVHGAKRAEGFYRAQGYKEMPFDDVSIAQEVIDLGKVL